MAFASGLFAEVGGFLPRFLEPHALAWCERVAATVPGVARSHYVECRLEGSPRVDFMSCFARGTLGATFRTRVHELGARSAAWRSNGRLIDEWQRPGGSLEGAPFLWLEYDAPATSGRGVLEASPSLAIESNYYERHRQSRAGLCAAERSLVHETLNAAASGPANAGPAVTRCLDALPPRGSIGYVSVMSARAPITVKLFVILPRADVREFLQRAEWSGDLPNALELLDSFYEPSVRTAYLDLTISDRLEERLGIASSQFQNREGAGGSGARRSRPRLPPSLAAEARELERWPGLQLGWLEGIPCWVLRWLDIKAVLDGNTVEYKAYLGFMRRLPRDRN